MTQLPEFIIFPHKQMGRYGSDSGVTAQRLQTREVFLEEPSQGRLQVKNRTWRFKRPMLSCGCRSTGFQNHSAV